jgi:hypothetical protein
MAQGTTGQGKVIDLTREGANQVERFAERLDRDGVDGLLRDLQTFARRRPGAFLAAGFGLGMVIGRLVRASDLGQSNDSGRSFRPSAEGYFPTGGSMERDSFALGSEFERGTTPAGSGQGQSDVGNRSALSEARRTDRVEDWTQ